MLILVAVVITIASLAMLNFTRSMLVSHEASRISNGRLQARMCAESGVQMLRLFLFYPRLTRVDMGGTWTNDLFYARNVVPDLDPARRGNFTIVAPGLDEVGNYSGLRYGLQNESAKLNLNTLAQLDALASSGALAGAASGASDESDPTAALTQQLASAATETMGADLASNMLLSLPGMTQDVADAILDWLDEDEEPRAYGAEFSDYYSQLQPAYKPANGPIQSIEQLLLVRGVTPQLLFGYDENRNGVLDASEASNLALGIPPGLAPGQLPVTNTDPNVSPPPPLGWAPYFTLHSRERNVTSDGSERININSDDLQTLYDDLVAVLGDENWASFIVAFRIGGQTANPGSSPLMQLASMAASESSDTGALGVQVGQLQSTGSAAGGTDAQAWSSDVLSSVDLSQGGSVKFSQVLDLFDATVTIGPNGEVYASPFSSLGVGLANSTPKLLDLLTTVDADAIPGRINIMECPREILLGIPGLSEEIADEIIAARVDGSESETRNFETWLVIEGYLTMDEMRGLMPLITCGGDVYKAQIVGYLEGDAAFSRVEVIVDGALEQPQIAFFRRLDHLGRGFEISTLGQRMDATVAPIGSLQ